MSPIYKTADVVSSAPCPRRKSRWFLTRAT